VIERRSILGDREKERWLCLMRSLAAFGGLEILTHAFLSNHLHILLHVPERRELSDAEFLERLGHVLEPYRSQFGPRRRNGARPMRFAEWGGLCTLRDLRLAPVSHCVAT
jgi:REP element-mobilizing transposase RayT